MASPRFSSLAETQQVYANVGPAGPTPWKTPVAFAAGIVCTEAAPATTVVYANETYVVAAGAGTFTTTSTFNPAQWVKVASKGAQGDQGDKGDKGDPGAAGPPGSALLGHFNVADYGIAPANSVATNDTAMSALLTTIAAAGGGILQFGQGAYNFSKIVLPNTAAAITTGAGVYPAQVPIAFAGAGAHFDGSWGGTTPKGGTQLQFNATGEPGYIQSYGVGLLGFDNITLRAVVSDGAPLIFGSNTTVVTRRLSLWGYSAASRNVGIRLGGSGVVINGTSTGPFQGYGTNIDDIFAHNISTIVDIGVYGNSIHIGNITNGNSCGGNQAILIDGTRSGSSPGQLATAITIDHSTIEMNNYVYAVELKDACYVRTRNVNGFDDGAGALAVIHISGNSYENDIDAGMPLSGGKPYLIDATASKQNYLRNTVSGGANRQRLTEFVGSTTVSPHKFSTPLLVAGGSLGFIVKPDAAIGGGKFIALRRSAADGTDANKEVLAITGNGAWVVDGTEAGNITNLLSSGAGFSNNGRTWSCNGTGGMMKQSSGTGGSYFDMWNYAVRFYTQGGTLVSTLGPVCGGGGYEGVRFGASSDVEIFRRAAGVMGFTGVLVPPSYTVATLPAASATLKGARATVTDATGTPAWMGAVSGGGSLTRPVFCDGSAWLYG